MEENKEKKGFVKETVDKAVDKVKTTAKKAIELGGIVVEQVEQNKEVAALFATGVVTVLGVVGKAAVKSYDRKARWTDKVTDLYDPHVRIHYKLKRPMTADQKREFNYRVKMWNETHETYYDILTDMDIDFD